ncbi:nucleoside phosphorylase [Homoserinimonas hongtaonis]|uniref:Uridine phosphorylase n=1 Tax=Homoserinimonas hongtaonis TaxID=2079791 RepID=A0A2U1T261_9MICO|nr:nucleoside phosphorylase [Salinibacterium hongtaonis]PWB97969.1 phosphorylase [Salinibacterium hongtaonis]
MASARTAGDPWLNGLPPHVPTDGRVLPSVCLLPGDPGRVDMATDSLDDFELIGNRREYRLGVGARNGQPVAVCSTGIGGPSTEIAIVELSRLGVSTFIRVGGMGAIPAEVRPGTITNVERALRDGGTARFYADGDEPIPAHPEVLAALNAAATRTGDSLTPITVLSCDSYYVGEGRSLPGLEAAAARRLEQVDALGADAMDMECETVFAVARALGRRYGAVLATHGNRTTDEWLEDYEDVQRRMLDLACDAAASLSAESLRAAF